MTNKLFDSISALILAGGRAQRMEGCDKGLVELQGRPMINHVLERLQPQLDLIRINANRNQDTYAALARHDNAKAIEVISDRLDDFQGPLAGIARGLEHCPTPWMLVVPCDTPFLPLDLVERLYQQAQTGSAQIAVAHDGQRLQPVVALLRRELYGSLMAYLGNGQRKIDRWYNEHPMVEVDFSDQNEAFLNINTLRDKQLLESQAV